MAAWISCLRGVTSVCVVYVEREVQNQIDDEASCGELRAFVVGSSCVAVVLCVLLNICPGGRRSLLLTDFV